MHGKSVPHAAGMSSCSRSAATLGDGRGPAVRLAGTSNSTTQSSSNIAEPRARNHWSRRYG